MATTIPLAGAAMGFLHSIASCYKHCSFRGRASRSDYLYWLLFVSLSSVVGCVLLDSFHVDDHRIIFHILSLPIRIDNVYFTVIALPSMTVIVRRLHDIDRSGWWLSLIMILPPIIVVYILSVSPRGIAVAIPVEFALTIAWLLVPLPFFCRKGTPGD